MSRLLLVGWDAADWNIADPLMADGRLPHLASLVQGGVRANLATLNPPISPMLWTSIATGKRPEKHGIYGFTEPTPDALGVRGIGNLGRATKAIWNILNQNGKRSVIVGWWPSHPAEPINGAMVSNCFAAPADITHQAPMAPGTVHPDSWRDRLADLRVHPAQVSGDMITAFAPVFASVDRQGTTDGRHIGEILAETISIYRAAVELIAGEQWDLAAVYFVGIDHFSHRFMRYHAKTQGANGNSENPSALADVVAKAYECQDAMLGDLMALAGADCSVLVLSDHGFHSGKDLPEYIPAEVAGPTVEHREFGMFCLSGPGILKGERVYGASVLDIAPTVLHLFGLPPGSDMDGKVLISAFEKPQLLQPVPSWDDIPGEDGRHDRLKQYDVMASVESFKHLVDLGYIAPLEGEAHKNVDNCVKEGRYNLALSYMDAWRPDKASAILNELIVSEPDAGRFHHHLVQCLIQCGELKGATCALTAFDRAAAIFAPKAQAELKRRRSVTADAELGYERDTPDGRERSERHELAEKATGFVDGRRLMRLQLAIGRAKGKKKSAVGEMLRKVAAGSVKRRPPVMFLAQGFTALGDHERALRYIRRALRADAENWRALALEAYIHSAAKRHEAVVDRAVESLSLMYFQPPTHLLLGVALRHLGDYNMAEDSCRVALAQMPGWISASSELARIARRQKSIGGDKQPVKAAAVSERVNDQGELHAARGAAEAGLDADALMPPFARWDSAPPSNRSQVVTVVTGLPRSGTSMMMQMLSAAGVEPHTDGKREADQDNPRGYFEHAQATRLYQDASWIATVRGKALKIVAHLLPFLPHDQEYRVIVMRRNLKEVIASQRVLSRRLSRGGSKVTDDQLMRASAGQFARVHAWLSQSTSAQLITVEYSEVLDSPAAVAARLEHFLGQPFNVAAAAAAVDVGLRRQYENCDE
jgi:predicted AlkP superfamily phosphohydrolase/phosphomutase/tetratricopeptide (TPR) repeat protein